MAKHSILFPSNRRFHTARERPSFSRLVASRSPEFLDFRARFTTAVGRRSRSWEQMWIRPCFGSSPSWKENRTTGQDGRREAGRPRLGLLPRAVSVFEAKSTSTFSGPTRSPLRHVKMITSLRSLAVHRKVSDLMLFSRLFGALALDHRSVVAHRWRSAEFHNSVTLKGSPDGTLKRRATDSKYIGIRNYVIDSVERRMRR